ncbi:MAG: hypothetical protein JXR91_03695 [Deltaproteobacteria bacterium]|nr:hypothetical protein [Deltaproteobacteria bacterium]
MKKITPEFKLLIIIFLLLFNLENAIGADLFGDAGLSGEYSSNIYMNMEKSPDFFLEPSLNAGIFLGGDFIGGYEGMADIFTNNRDLFYHNHELYIEWNPVWGDDDENGYYINLYIETGRNTRRFASVNILKPGLDTGITLEPRSWFRWNMSASYNYNYFYDDIYSSSSDTFVDTSITFTLPARTTITPLVSYGIRTFTYSNMLKTDTPYDQEIIAGVHLSQNLWRGGGLQGDYKYRYSFGDNALISTKINELEFNYIGEDFLFTGHYAGLIFKQIFQNGLEVGAKADFSTKSYNGFENFDINELPTGIMRYDQVLTGGGWLMFTRFVKESEPESTPEFSTSLSYFYERQWSNNDWYNTSANIINLEIKLSW